MTVVIAPHPLPDDDCDPTRRHLLRLAAASIAVPLLPMFVAEAAPLTYGLKPLKLDDGAWMIAGAQEAITFENGGAIANITILIHPTARSSSIPDRRAALAKSWQGWRAR